MNFNVTINRDPGSVLETVCMLAQDKVIVSGDTNRGRFSGMFDGQYSVDGRSVSVRIDKKPIFVPWSVVRRGLDYLAS